MNQRHILMLTPELSGTPRIVLSGGPSEGFLLWLGFLLSARDEERFLYEFDGGWLSLHLLGPDP